MTGRPRDPNKLIPRTVRNPPDVDDLLVHLANVERVDVSVILREACARYVGVSTKVSV